MAPISAAASSSTKLTVRTLTDGGQQPLEIAHAIADWIGEGAYVARGGAVRLSPRSGHGRRGRRRDPRGVGTRRRRPDHLQRRPPWADPGAPPPEPDVKLIESLGVPSKAVGGVPDLMHHKFVVRDRQAVWTGSTNWTDDSWSRQENVILSVESPELAESFVEDFEQLWAKDVVEETGFVAPKRLRIDGLLIRPWFTPGYGERPVGADRPPDRTCETAGADLLSGDHRRARARNAGAASSPRASPTSRAAWTHRRSKASSTSGARTATVA